MSESRALDSVPADSWKTLLTGSALKLYTAFRTLHVVIGSSREESEEDARAALEFDETNNRADARARSNQQMLIDAHRDIQKEKFGDAEARADARQFEMNAAVILGAILGPGAVSEEAKRFAPGVAVELAYRLREMMTPKLPRTSESPDPTLEVR